MNPNDAVVLDPANEFPVIVGWRVGANWSLRDDICQKPHLGLHVSCCHNGVSAELSLEDLDRLIITLSDARIELRTALDAEKTEKEETAA